MLYRYIWHRDCHPGYLVYRAVFDESKCDVPDGAMAHRVALFVEESAAKDYCRYRNELTDKNGSDKLS